MTALKWRSAGKNSRVADGHYAGWWYELERVHPPLTLPYWVTRFYDGTDERSQVLADHVNFMQARAAAIKHHNLPGY